VTHKFSLSLGYAVLALLIGYLVLVPLNPLQFDSAHNWARMAQMPLLLASAAYVLLIFSHSRLEASPWVCFWALLLAFALASAFRAAMPMVALREIALMAGLIILAIGIDLTGRQLGIKPLMAAISVSWAVYAASFLLVLMMVLSTGAAPDGWSLIAGFDNPRFLNHAQAVSIPLLLGIAGSTEVTQAWRRLTWFALIVSFALLALSFGRAAIVALAGAGVLAPLLFGRAGWRFLVRLGALAIFGALLYYCVFQLVPAWRDVSVFGQLHSPAQAGSDHSRFYLWQIAVEHILGSPWLGIGPMHFAHFTNAKGAHPHNVYLQVPSEYGLPVLLLVVGGAAYALMRAAFRIRKLGGTGDVSLAIGAFCACLAAAVDGLFSGNFVMPVSQVWIAVAVGILIYCVGESPNGGESNKGSLVIGRAAALLLLLSQCGMAAISISEVVLPIPHIDVSGVSTQAVDSWRPRYWLDGWF
jgi:O-antigen ligase